MRIDDLTTGLEAEKTIHRMRTVGRVRWSETLLLGAAVGAILGAPVVTSAQRPPPRGPAVEPELEIVAQFDRDGDERLDATERAEARRWLESRGTGRFGVPGGRAVFGGGVPTSRGIVPGSPGMKVQPADVPVYPDADLYDTRVLRTIFIDFESDDWERELAAFYNTDVEVPATVTVDGRVYRGVGVGFRGQSSFRSVPEGSKRSLKLSIDYLDDDQRIGGYRTLNLLNAMNDPTFVRTVLYSEIARSYLPAPKVNFVRVVINGEYWGVYLNAQQFNKDFLDDFFGENDGVRWKAPGMPNGRSGMQYLGDDPALYRPLYEIKSGDRPERWADLINLFKVLDQTPLEQLEEALEPIFDVDGALRFLALEVVLVNSDGYWTRASDYNLYQDESGRFHIIPHDMNEALGVGGNVRLDPLVGLNDRTKPLRSRLLAVPSLRERYLAYVKDIATNWLDWNRLEPIVREYQALIGEHVAADTRKLYPTEEFTQDVETLRSFVERRREFLLN